MRARNATATSSRLIAILFFSLGACGSSDQMESINWRATFDTIGDTIIVRTEGSVWRDTARLVQDLRIGVLEGTEEYMFGYVQSLAVGPDGSIYTYDGQMKALRKHSSDGAYVATFGREGEGPGEYKRPDAGLVVLADGRVLLRDPGNARISVFATDGKYLDGWRIRGGPMTSDPMFWDTAGNVYQWVTVNPEDDFTLWRTGLVSYGPRGATGDTLEVPDYHFEPPFVQASRGGESRMFASTPVPFSPQIKWAFSPLGYFVVGLSTRYAIDFFPQPGRVFRIERADWTPIPLQAPEREEQERRITAMMQGIDPSWRWNGPPIPETKPPYKNFFLGKNGRLWVELHQHAVRNEAAEEEAAKIRPGYVSRPVWQEALAFDIFEPDGTYLGMVEAPAGIRTQPTPVANGDTLWAVVADEMAVQYVARFRVTHGAVDLAGGPESSRP